MSDHDAVRLSKRLIALPSVSPEDAGCQQLIADFLKPLGFTVQSFPCNNVSNLWAIVGDEGPLLVFAGHTDVVPSGPLDQWQSHPFDPSERDGYLYGRGAADMKSSIAAMMVACRDYLSVNPRPKGRIAFLITSAEDGDEFLDGTPYVLEQLGEQAKHIDYCIIGEPSSTESLGDTIKVGRRGSLTGHLTFNGKQGHIAYPHLADNPIHNSFAALSELTEHSWDKGNDFFPPTQLQISNINGGTGAGNVIPGELVVQFNFRYSSEITHEQLQQQVQLILDKHGVDYSIEWIHNGAPYLTQPCKLIDIAQRVIKAELNVDCEPSTSGGTSDGRFIAKYVQQVVELGPVNKSIHKIDECVKVDDVVSLSGLYKCMLEELL